VGDRQLSENNMVSGGCGAVAPRGTAARITRDRQRGVAAAGNAQQLGWRATPAPALSVLIRHNGEWGAGSCRKQIWFLGDVGPLLHAERPQESHAPGRAAWRLPRMPNNWAGALLAAGAQCADQA
jgi:hypothetical protein